MKAHLHLSIQGDVSEAASISIQQRNLLSIRGTAAAAAAGGELPEALLDQLMGLEAGNRLQGTPGPRGPGFGGPGLFALHSLANLGDEVVFVADSSGLAQRRTE